MTARIPITFFGASPRTSNMGVNALFASTIAGIRNRLHNADLTVFDTALGERREPFHVDSGEPVTLRFLGYRTGKRIYRSENLIQMNLASRLGPLGATLNSGVTAIRASVATLDVSGGDSFTDMYPDDRIQMVAGCKELVLRMNRPLILLPQTYGPFDESLERASRIVQAATACFARDERSFESLKKMLGSHFDPDRHRCGVDMSIVPRNRWGVDGGASTVGRRWGVDTAPCAPRICSTSQRLDARLSSLPTNGQNLVAPVLHHRASRPRSQ